HEQHHLRPMKLRFRDKVYAADSDPKIDFRSVLEEIVRKNEARNAWFAITFRLEREVAAMKFTKVRAKKCSDPGAPAFWNGEDDRFASGKLGRATAEISAH